jgi:hypothetical protein
LKYLFAYVMSVTSAKQKVLAAPTTNEKRYGIRIRGLYRMPQQQRLPS